MPNNQVFGRSGGGFAVYNSNDDAADWSTRLLKTLEKLDSKYVLTFLDDEFIQNPVNVQSFMKGFLRLKRNPFIAYIIYVSAFGKGDGVSSRLYSDFNKIKRTYIFQQSANCSLWKKDRLMKFLKSGETPWEFEINSKKRRGLFDLVYMYKQGTSPIDVSFRINLGYGITNGKWLWKNEELFLKNGICNVDFSKRGVISEEEVNEKMEAWRRKHKQEKEKKKNLIEVIRENIDLYKSAMPDELHEFLRKVKHLGRS